MILAYNIFIFFDFRSSVVEFCEFSDIHFGMDFLEFHDFHYFGIEYLNFNEFLDSAVEF